METTGPHQKSRPAGRTELLTRKIAGSGDALFSNLTLLFALGIVGLFVAMLILLNIDAMQSIRKFGLSFFTSTVWNAVTEEFGALPAIYGTLLTSFIGMALAAPISLGAAIFLAELAPGWIRTPASFLIEMLAAIPSVIIGLWGLFVLVPFVRSPVESWLGDKLGFIPLFQGPPFGVGFLAAGLILAIMTIPIITALSRDVIRAVPQTQREAMLALGATRWETINQAVLPYCRSGIIGALILGLGRALGETMAVTMVIGNRPEISASLFAPAYTMASIIANEFSEATYDLYRSAIVEIGLVLLGVTVLLNAGGRLLVWSVSRSVKGRAE